MPILGVSALAKFANSQVLRRLVWNAPLTSSNLSWRVMKDFAESAEPAKGNEPAKPAFISENAAVELWPILEKRYSKSGETTYLKMVEGMFIDQ